MHNGKQPITHRNLGKCQGKPQCGETQQERERSIIQLQESVLQQQTNNFQPRKNTSQHQQTVPKFLP